MLSSSSKAVRRAASKATKPSLARGAHKEIRFSNEGRASILKGVDVLANAVSVTLGPKGRFYVLCILARIDGVHRSQCHHRAVVRWSQNHQG